jgi:ferric-dicitrate binding protein FerR (iron transport regulator)
MTAHHPDPRRLFAFLDGKMAPREQMELRGHAEACPECARRLEGLRRTRAALRELGGRMPVPPADNPIAEAKLMQALRERAEPRVRVDWWWLPVTAGATLVLALLVLPRFRSSAGGGGVAVAGGEAVGTRGNVGTVMAVRGPVDAGPAADRLAAAHAGEDLAPSTMVRAGADAEAKLALVAGGDVTVAAATTVVMPADAEAPLRLEGGAIDVAVVPRPEGRKPFGVETPLARIEAVGTKFRVVHEAGRTSVDVQEGKVRFVSLHSDEEKLVVAGAKATVNGSGAIREGEDGALVAAAPAPPLPLPPAPPEVVPPEVVPGPAALATEEPVRIERPRGTIDGGKVRARVSRQRAAFGACRNDYILRGGTVLPEARVVFVVLEDGSIGRISVTLTPVDDAVLRECIERVFRSIEFPRPQGGPARVVYPIALTQ